MGNTVFIGVQRNMSRLRKLRKQRMKKSLALRMVDGGSLLLTVSGGKPVIKFCVRSIKKK